MARSGSEGPGPLPSASDDRLDVCGFGDCRHRESGLRLLAVVRYYLLELSWVLMAILYNWVTRRPWAAGIAVFLPWEGWRGMDADYGAEPIHTTVNELSDRILEGYVLWLVAGRGLEGMDEEEILANVRRMPSARWLAMYVQSPELAVVALQADPKNTFE